MVQLQSILDRLVSTPSLTRKLAARKVPHGVIRVKSDGETYDIRYDMLTSGVFKFTPPVEEITDIKPKVRRGIVRR